MSEITESRDTKDVIKSMLTENTGRALCDSGGAYGRNWERNQGKDFESSPAVSVEFGVYGGDLEISATLSLFHWMDSKLEFDAEMQARLDAFTEERSESESWFSIVEDFAQQEQEAFSEQGYSDCKEFPRVTNTYNDPDHWHLSQVIQFTELSEDDGYEATHLIIMVHGGCDARGGYTAPKCFRIKGVSEYDWYSSAHLGTVHVNGWYWDYSWMGKGHVESSTPRDDPRKCPPSLPENFFDIPAFKEGEDLDDEDLNDWRVIVSDGGREAHLHAPLGYTNEDDDVGPWPVHIGNSYI